MKQTLFTGDGVPFEVEQDARFDAFDSLRHDQSIVNALGLSSGRFQGRDAQEGLGFIVSQLAYTEATTYERLYTPLQYQKFLPISNAAGEWATSIRYETEDWAGQGKRFSGMGEDIPYVDVGYGDVSYPIHGGAVGYRYTTEELRESAYLRKPLPTTRAQAALRAWDRHMNSVALFGEIDLPGLYNNPVIPVGTVVNGAWGTTTTDPKLIVKEMGSWLYQVWNATNFNDIPTDIVMAPAAYAYISQTPMSATNDSSNVSILNYFLQSNLAKDNGLTLTVSPGFGLDTLGVGTTRRALIYIKSEDRIIMHIPLPVRFLAPQLRGLKVEIPGEYKYGGVQVRYPKSALIIDGI